MKYILFVLLTIFSYRPADAQSSVSLASGISVDLKNTPPFFGIPVMMRWNPFRRHQGFFLEGIQNFGLNKTSTADAYTPDPAFPAHAIVKKAIRSSSFSAGLGGTILLFTGTRDDQILLSFSAGFSDRNYRVNYRHYDHIHYEVLNPDVDYSVVSPYLSLSGFYDFSYKKNRMFVMLRVQSAEIRPAMDRYPYSFKEVIPLELTYGYRLVYNKK